MSESSRGLATPGATEGRVRTPPPQVERVRTLPSLVGLALILVAFVALAIGYAVATPPWNNPDEPAHFNYARHVADTGRLPVLRPGDWDAELLERLKATRFPEETSIYSIRYESHQPPLYYLLSGGAYLMAAGASIPAQVLTLKAISILLSTLVVICSYLVGRQLIPSSTAVGLLAAATTAFVPMHTAIAAAVNNDSLANALAGVTLVALLVGVARGFDDRGAVALGLLIGATLLTKVTVYVYVPLSLAVLIWTGRRDLGPEAGWRDLLRRPVLALAAAGAVSSWWFLRNMLVYGWADPLASVRHDEVVVGQPRWAAIDLEAADHLAQVLFRSFWGQFGWMGVVLDNRLYLLYLALTIVALIGLALVGAKLWKSRDRATACRSTLVARLAVLLTAIGLVVGGVIYYNLTFIQPQGRYLFPALIPITVLLAWGWATVASEAGRLTPWPGATAHILMLSLGVGLGLLNLLCLVRFVAPAFR